MSATGLSQQQAPPAYGAAGLSSAQPGGGLGHRIEEGWARLRRWRLKHLRPRYVERMARLRRGDPAGAPHEILDPRDLKYCRVACDCRWDEDDDPFRWRRRVPLAGWGAVEMNLFGWPLLVLTAIAAWWTWPAALVPGAVLVWLVAFFRDPPRSVPQGPGLFVSPADGKIVEITRLADDDFVGGPAVRVGIFLSIFNVHINRAPAAARVVGIRYTPGKFFNAMKPESARENENTWIGFEEEGNAARRFAVRQISGAIARRIVCDLKPGETLARGAKFGMIKFGSRTELILPDGPDLEIAARTGQTVKAGRTVLAKYTDNPGQNAKSLPQP
jgi:phosphatidylserine decarboxylase